MLADALAYLRCPHCARDLDLTGAKVRCANGHSFDVARQGYVTLAAGDLRATIGDDAGMVAARETFLATGHFAPLTEAVAEEARVAAGERGCVVDIGAGLGGYLAATLDSLPDRVGIALDASRPALQRAARAHPRVAAVRCDVWHALPLRDETAAVALGVFAPRNGPEAARVLRRDGALVVATPTAAHLAELVSALGLLTVDARKQERLAGALAPFFERAAVRRVEWQMTLGRAEVRALVAMGPSAHHVGVAELDERAGALPEPMTVTASVTLSRHVRRSWRAAPL